MSRKRVWVLAGMVAVLIAGALAWNRDDLGLLLMLILVTILVGCLLVGYQVRGDRNRLAEEIKETSSHFEGLATREQVSSLEGVVLKTVLGQADLAAELARSLEEHAAKQGRTFELLKSNSEALELLQERLVEIDQSTGESIARVEKELSGRAATDLRNRKQLIAEMDALWQVHRATGLEGPMPLLGGWALGGRGMLQAIRLAESAQARMIVECGSGTSTVYLAKVMERVGGRIVALEHLEEYRDMTLELLRHHGLEDVSEVRLAPLESVDIAGETYLWYSLNSLEGLEDVDMLLVDGPPQDVGRLARYPALPLLVDRLVPGAVVLVDDANRSDERNAIEKWRGNCQFEMERSLDPEQTILRLT